MRLIALAMYLSNLSREISTFSNIVLWLSLIFGFSVFKRSTEPLSLLFCGLFLPQTQVRVSVNDDANSTTIVIKVAEKSCNISIHSAITRETAGSGRVIRMPLTPTYTLLLVFLLLVAVAVCIVVRRWRNQDGDPAYQKLDMSDLPVSVGGKKEHDDRSDKWDDNWGDDWDDEEAPVTPSKPLPNPSSKGLAPRRSAKDGWKD